MKISQQVCCQSRAAMRGGRGGGMRRRSSCPSSEYVTAIPSPVLCTRAAMLCTASLALPGWRRSLKLRLDRLSPEEPVGNWEGRPHENAKTHQRPQPPPPRGGGDRKYVPPFRRLAPPRPQGPG